MTKPIRRRDFLNGVALSIGTVLGRPALGGEQTEGPQVNYPPALTGMRGSHAGVFETAHALRDGKFPAPDAVPKDLKETYDLIVVGGGIGGLAAAYFYRARAGASARILILDNHDDFGGHAQRNELRPRGRLLLSNAGTYAIQSPTPYSAQAEKLLAGLGIHPTELYKKGAVKSVYRGLNSGLFFDKETFGADKLVSPLPPAGTGERSKVTARHWADLLSTAPLSAAAREDIIRLEKDKTDYFAGLSESDKKLRLSKMSYRDFLLNHVKVGQEVLPIYQTLTHDEYGVGIDAFSALDCWAHGFPGFAGMKLKREPSSLLGYTANGEVTKQKPYFFHYPDGNASIARLLVRSLIPASASGNSAQDIVLAKMNYDQLDPDDSPVRLRLNSTAVKVRHIGSPDSASEVEVQYARGNELYSVRAKAVVLACWNSVIPHLCPELPPSQKSALAYGVKVPLVYSVVAISNWRPFHRLGVKRIETPGMYHTAMWLDDAVDIGGYQSPKSPDDPILVRMLRTPCKPGLPPRDQHRIGRYDLLTTPFATFERKIRDQMGRVLGGAGFDPARDIEAITVNRWPHGYAYEYNSLFDPRWPAGTRPCDLGRARFGRIAIANSDAAGTAYTDKAIDESYRAVEEILSI